MLNRREFTGLLSTFSFLNFMKPKTIEPEIEVIVEKVLDNYPDGIGIHFWDSIMISENVPMEQVIQ